MTDTILEEKICNICCNNYTKKSRIPIKCCFCTFEACRECYENYLLTINNAKCMNNDCDKLWTRKFLTDHFTRFFIINKYKKHLEKIFFDKERALLPATQQIVEEIIKKETIELENIELTKSIEQLTKFEWLMNNIIELKKNEESYKKWIVNDFINRISEISIEQLQSDSKEITNKMTEIFNLKKENELFLRFDYEPKEKMEKKQFIRKCGNYVCRGFLSTQWKCGICTKFTCKECHVYKEIDDVHICKLEDVETAKLLNNDSKACPKCATMIFKIDGCDQMWCTQCNTAFSWKSGLIETKSIHNPHYYEYLRKSQNIMPRNPNDIICGRELHNTIIPGTLKYVNDRMFTRISIIIGSTIHIQRVELPRFEINDVLNNERLRIYYLRNIISEKEFCIKLQREYKKYDKYKEIHSILSMYISSVTDILYRFIDYYDKNNIAVDEMNPRNGYTNILIKKYDKMEIQELNHILKEIDYLIEYVNDYLDQISIIYQSVTYRIELPMDNEKGYYHVFHSIHKKGKSKNECDDCDDYETI
jgi:hypothetical protein